MNRIFLLSVGVVLAACGSDDDGSSFDGTSIPSCDARSYSPDLMVLGTSLSFDASALDSFDSACEAGTANHLVASGDAAIRWRSKGAFLINRGPTGNIIALTDTFEVSGQVALPNCNPRDAIVLPDDRALVSCYDDTTLRLVDVVDGQVDDGPNLASYADGDGIPEMGNLYQRGDEILLALQRLDRANFYEPTGTSALLRLDATAVAAGSNGVVEEIPLPCQNPFTRIRGGDSAIFVGCAGNFASLGTGGIATLPHGSTTSTLVETDTGLGGRPADIEVTREGEVFVIVDVPGAEAFSTDEMRAVRLGDATPLYDSPGFSLAGIAFRSGRVWVGDRSADETSGLWAIDPSGERSPEAFPTTLPPIAIESFRQTD